MNRVQALRRAFGHDLHERAQDHRYTPLSPCNSFVFMQLSSIANSGVELI